MKKTSQKPPDAAELFRRKNLAAAKVVLANAAKFDGALLAWAEGVVGRQGQPAIARPAAIWPPPMEKRS